LQAVAVDLGSDLFGRGQVGELASEAAPLRSDFGGRDVVAKTEEDRGAQPLVLRPVGVLDLRDQLRLDPRHSAIRFRPHREGARLRYERLQFSIEAGERFLIEARPDVAHPAQLASVILSEHQRAEVVAIALRFGKTADNELLLTDDFDLEPIAA